MFASISLRSKSNLLVKGPKGKLYIYKTFRRGNLPMAQSFVFKLHGTKVYHDVMASLASPFRHLPGSTSFPWVYCLSILSNTSEFCSLAQLEFYSLSSCESCSIWIRITKENYFTMMGQMFPC